MPECDDPVQPPPPPGTTPAPSLPVIGILAPLVASVLLAVIFQSTLALAFGLLGPIIALASWWEALRTHRRQSAAQREEEEQRQLDHERERAQEEARYRRQRLREAPAIDQALANPLWRPLTPPAPPLIRIGLGAEAREPTDTPIHGVPFMVTLEHGLAVVGDGPSAFAVWRAIVLSALAHAKYRGWENLSSAIDSDVDPPNVLEFRAVSSSTVISLRLVARPSEVAEEISTVIKVLPGSAELLRDGVVLHSGIVPDQISFAAWRHLAALSGLAETLSPDTQRPNDSGSQSARAQLWARLSPDFSFDFVSEGPHALFWGQTGSGKSLALQMVLRSVASRYTPEEVSFAVIDFKGGAGLVDVAELDHLVGTLTDLDEHLVGRVAKAIEAQIVRREQLLAEHRARDITSLDPAVVLPRLILVIDEVAYLLQRHPEWESLLSDVASRGRALGIHLVIAGQRLVGQVPRSVVVNAPIRVCLRVLDSAEATDFLPGVSTQSLSALRHSPPGAFLGVTATRCLTMSRVLVEEMSARSGASSPLWRDPLPPILPPSHPLVLSPDAWAVADDPDTASYLTLGETDVPAGLCALMGDAGCGHSSALHAIAHSVGSARQVWLPDTPAEWIHAVYRLRRGERPPWALPTGPLVVLTDRLDRIFRDHTVDQRDWVVDLLSDLVQTLSDESPLSSAVVTVATHSEWVRPLLRRSSALITLSGAQCDPLIPLGGGGSVVRGPLTPGRASWSGREIQFVALPSKDMPARWSLDPERIEQRSGAQSGLVVLADSTDAILPRGWRSILIADAEAHWREIEQARLGAALVLSGLSRDQAKSVAGFVGSVLPPAPHGRGWLLGLLGPQLVSLPSGEAGT